jgi:prepilin-type N-terminal cleavage/methylation domain-containing protein/prepilin-type processing-associated H-X9-DG protein
MRRAFTLLELLVAMAIITILMAILLPALERVRHQGYIDKCASNLRTIGQALEMYANDNHGAFPRTMYVQGSPIVFGTNSAAPDPFLAGGPVANDVTAAAFLLMRTQKMPPAVFICPYDDVFEFQPDPGDIENMSNFTNEKVNLGYSFADPYPDTAAANAGYKWTASLSADFAIASDRNPGTDPPKDDVIDVLATSVQDAQDKGNSENHEKDGQNVLFGDGHVEWERSPFCGVSGDNIFTNQNNVLTASPVTKDDSLLLPTDEE